MPPNAPNSMHRFGHPICPWTSGGKSGQKGSGSSWQRGVCRVTERDRFRIAVGGLHIECSTFNPLRTRDEDFDLLTGESLLESPHFRALKTYDADFLPTLYAHALPGAPIAFDTYLRLKRVLLDSLCQAAPVDGVYLMMHGAAYVDGLEDAEGDLLSAVRATVGDTVPISVSYDLHGNLSDRVMTSIDMFAAYRTAPHIDVHDTHCRALDQLFQCLTTGQRPFLCWCPIPVVLSGERTSTEDPPAQHLYEKLAAIDETAGIWDASLLVGYVWVDEPRITAASVVVGTDKAAMQDAALGLAQAYWNARRSFVFGSPSGSIEECIAKALKPGPCPFVLADSGDNPTGGGVGDRVDVLRAVLASDCDNTLVAGIADAPATKAAFDAGQHQTARFVIGGSLDPATSIPIEIDAEILRLVEGAAPRDKQAVLRAGGVTFVVTEKRRPFHLLADFQALGLDPAQVRILVVKSGYLVPEIKTLAARTMMALSPGVVDQAVERQPRQRYPKGIFPFDDLAEFTPAVRWTD